MPTNCQFVFERSTPIFYSDEQIIGNAVLSTTKQLKLEAITLTFFGLGKVHWTELPKTPHITHDDSTDISQKLHYHGKDTYVKNTVVLAENIVLNPDGLFNYEFRFIVPTNTPATCKQNYGEIVYGLKLTLKNSNHSKYNKSFQHNICIKRRQDLTGIRELNESHTIFGTLNSNQVKDVEFSVPFTGVVPGQQLNYHLKYGNTPFPHKVIVNLCQDICYKSSQPEVKLKEVSRILATVQKTKKLASPYGQILDDVMSIPLALPLSTCDNDAIIRISYYLETVFVDKKGKVLLRLKIPLTIGSRTAKDANSIEEYHVHCYDNLGMPEDVFDEPAVKMKRYQTNFEFSTAAENVFAKNVKKYDQFGLLGIKKLLRLRTSFAF